MYQQLCLGALKINWQPPSERLAVGTIDDGIYAIQDDLLGQLPTTHIDGDRDKWLEQPAELEDVMYRCMISNLKHNWWCKSLLL